MYFIATELCFNCLTNNASHLFKVEKQAGTGDFSIYSTGQNIIASSRNYEYSLLISIHSRQDEQFYWCLDIKSRIYEFG